MKSIAHLPAIQWGNYCEPFVIKDFERDHPGKVTMTGLHISKEHPNIGNAHSKGSVVFWEWLGSILGVNRYRVLFRELFGTVLGVNR